jgi:AcrR family transcriptional regulator
MPPRSEAKTRRRGPGRPVGSSGEDRRTALLDACQEILVEKGTPRVTLREVADRAGVKPALVHYYFGTKEDLLHAVADRLSERMLETIEAELSQEGSIEERMGNMVRAAMRNLGTDRYGPRLIAEQIFFGEDDRIESFAAKYARKNLENIEKILDEGREAGVFRDVDPMLLVPSLFGSGLFFFLVEPILKRIFGIDGITPELVDRFAEHQVELLLHGITRAPASRNGSPK